MAYQSTRQQYDVDEDQAKMEHEHQNAKKTTKTAAKAAGAYFGGAAGAKAVDLASKTKLGDKILNQGARVVQSNPLLNRASNRLNDSGVMDKANKTIDFTSSSSPGQSSSVNNGIGAGSNTPGQTPNQVKNTKTTGGEQDNSSLPSSGGKRVRNSSDFSNDKKEKNDNEDNESSSTDSAEEEKEEKTNSIFGVVGTKKAIIIASLIMFPAILFLALVLIIGSVAVGLIANYDDAFGVSDVASEKNGNMSHNSSDTKRKAFYERVNSVKMRYQAQGKTVDAYKIAAVYSVIHNKNSKFSYNDMTDEVITSIADAMFDGNEYNDTTFKMNLSSNVLPKYATGSIDYSKMADEVIDYITDYESLIGKQHVSSSSSISGVSSTNERKACAATKSCTYNINGYYIKGKGTVKESIQVKDLYVRLMQCGKGNGHDYGGTFGKPLAGEVLVPFEKYILGVAYHAMGANAPVEAFKAEMIAARGFILSRHADLNTDMKGWRTLKKESGRWVLRVASCTQDLVYCDPDRGCSSNDAEWGQVHSGLKYDTGFSKQPLAEDSPLRTYASETTGEVLVNEKGYIVYTNYVQKEQKQFIELANKGLNYKQILLQLYNQDTRNYKVSGLYKAACSNSGSSSCGGAVGDFINWKQKGETWSSIQMGRSGRTIGQIGCLVTSIAIQIARSGVETNTIEFDPGTFVEILNAHGAFDGGGSLNSYAKVTEAAPSFQYRDRISIAGLSRQQKFKTISNLLNQPDTYVVAEVYGDTGQHWVALDSIEGNSIKMMDPGSKATNLWREYNWRNTSTLVYFTVS